jgi:hypothetical protein
MDENIQVKTIWCFVKTRLSQAEYQAFVQVLQKLGTNGSRFLRKVIREVIGEGPDLLINDLQAFRDAIYQLGAIGRNLNQLVRAFNSGQLAIGQVDSSLLIEIRDQVARLEKELLAIVLRSRQRWVNHG